MMFRWTFFLVVTYLTLTRAKNVGDKVTMGNSLNETDAKFNLANLPSYLLFGMVNKKKYGNWCGENHGSGPTIDRIDQCCKAHDGCHLGNCYQNDDNCTCNKTFRNCLEQAKKSCKWYQRYTSYCTNARAIYDYADEAYDGACKGYVTNAYYWAACDSKWGPAGDTGGDGEDYDYDYD
jgi:hypothetical protein